MSGAGVPAASSLTASAQQPAPTLTTHPWVGIAAVLCGAFISTVTGRLSSFGLADIRGGVGAGFDEGAWITTASGCAQMLVGPLAVWLAVVFGPRRVLEVSCPAFAIASLLLPLSPDLPTLLTFQALAGLASGTFVPLTISFVLRNLEPRYWAYGIAAYALNLELSLNISASLEGWYIDHLSWRWIFWQSVPLAVLMALFVHRGIPKGPVDWPLLRRADWFGMASLSLGLAMVYAAIDQGNRLDWLGSGLVVGLLAGGGLLVLAFVVHERRTPQPWINLGLILRYPIPLVMGLLVTLRLAILSTALLVPQFLIAVRGLRTEDVGPALLAIALPQLVIAPLTGILLRRVDARLGIAAGFATVGLACLLVSQGLTRDWVPATFLPTQGLQAVGQTLAMSSMIFLNVQHLRPAEALSFGVILQTARLFGGVLGAAGMATWLRVREQVASQLIGLNVEAGDLLTQGRLHAYAAAVSPQSIGPAQANARAVGLLSSAVRKEANIQAYIDGFLAVAIIMLLALVLAALLRPPPVGPASPRPLRQSGRQSPNTD